DGGGGGNGHEAGGGQGQGDGAQGCVHGGLQEEAERSPTRAGYHRRTPMGRRLPTVANLARRAGRARVARRRAGRGRRCRAWRRRGAGLQRRLSAWSASRRLQALCRAITRRTAPDRPKQCFSRSGATSWTVLTRRCSTNGVQQRRTAGQQL